MSYSKILLACILAGAFFLAGTANAQPSSQPEALANAVKNWPALQGLTPEQIAAAMQNCPGLNGQLPGANCPALNGNLDPVALAQAAKKCPALNPNLPAEAQKCPALEGAVADPSKCPAFADLSNGSMSKAEKKLAKKADARMQSVVKNLERNKRSADALIQAAREAGAAPEAISDMEKMSEAFRQVFMSTVSPQQLVESIFSAPQAPQAEGIIITGPDGTTWLVTPNQQATPQAQPQQKPAMKKIAPKPQDQTGLPPFGQKPPKQPKPQQPVPPQVMAPQNMSPQGGFMPQQPRQPKPQQPVPPQVMAPQNMPPQGGFMPQQPMPPQGGFVMPRSGQQPMAPQMMAPQGGFMPQQPIPPQGGFIGPRGGQQPMAPQGGITGAPQQNPQDQGAEIIIIQEETNDPAFMPLWPTKEQVGGDGILNYLEKRSMLNAAQ